MNQVNYTAQKAWKAFHFVMRVLKKGNRNTESLAHTSLVHPILEYGSACWDPCRGQIYALDLAQITRFTLSKNFWSSAVIINLVNYFCFNLYCIVLLLRYKQYLISESAVLTFFICIVLCRLFCLTSFTPDCCITEFEDLRNDMYEVRHEKNETVL